MKTIRSLNSSTKIKPIKKSVEQTDAPLYFKFLLWSLTKTIKFFKFLCLIDIKFVRSISYVFFPPKSNDL